MRSLHQTVGPRQRHDPSPAARGSVLSPISSRRCTATPLTVGQRFMGRVEQTSLAATNNNVHPSIDGDDESGHELAEELTTLIDPERATRMKRHYELLWKVAQAQGANPDECCCCRGTGERECDWCHGTGVLTVGDKIYVSNMEGNKCPVCRGHGYVKCEFCRGTGNRAQWLGPEDDPQSQRKDKSCAN